MSRLRWPALVMLAAVLAAAVVLSGSRAGQEQPASQQEQIRQLQQRVERLEARVTELERHQPRVIVPAQGAPELRVVPEGQLQQVPKGWIPREFNGQRYYDIPLDRTAQGR